MLAAGKLVALPDNDSRKCRVCLVQATHVSKVLEAGRTEVERLLQVGANQCSVPPLVDR